METKVRHYGDVHVEDDFVTWNLKIWNKTAKKREKVEAKHNYNFFQTNPENALKIDKFDDKIAWK